MGDVRDEHDHALISIRVCVSVCAQIIRIVCKIAIIGSPPFYLYTRLAIVLPHKKKAAVETELNVAFAYWFHAHTKPHTHAHATHPHTCMSDDATGFTINCAF